LTAQPVGVRGQVGCKEIPKVVDRLVITKPGVYENILVDGKWADGNLVKIQADDVTLRHCEIKNGTHNGITVYAKNVVIDSCRIHSQLKGTFKDQQDAHGITGRPVNLVVRNCEIYHVSGDALQFDPGRGVWDNVVVENCALWTGPLPADAAGFKKGERPGENALDTKQLKKHPRSRIVLRNCLCHGWGNGQISTQAALNIKDHVDALVENCVCYDNDYCFRLRGDTGERGGARVTLRNCAVYRSKVAVRMEDRIEGLRIENLAIGAGIGAKYQVAAGAPRDLVNKGEFEAPRLEEVVKEGVKPPPRRFKLSDQSLLVETVFEDDFSQKSDDWLIEGPLQVKLAAGRLFFDARERKPPAGTIWCKRAFAGDQVVEYVARIEEGPGSTNLNFFLFGSNLDGSSVLGTTGQRTGDYGEYHKLNNYIYTYLNDKDKEGAEATRVRFRKDPGFHLLLQEWRKQPIEKGRDYHFTIAVQGPRLRFYVDGQLVLDHRETETGHRHGHHAFRTFQSHVSADLFRISRIVCEKP
ncbi:MAG: DUF1961 family protein, partial [Gemmataceae bacterium]